MSEMVERVAKASFECWCRHHNENHKFEELSTEEYEFALEHAKAIVEAMRMPTDNVISAGAMIMLDYDPGHDDMLRCWQACIDEMLKPV